MPAIGVHHTDTSEGSWDGPANEARLRLDESEAYYRRAFAWQDPDGDPETKAAYKFIHHEVDADGSIGAANLRACQTGIGVLNGGRGGANIPDADRQGVYNHLAAHLRDADVEPPDLREVALPAWRRPPVGVETRYLQTEMRVEQDGRIEGYAAVFGQWSEILGWFRERIQRGAFKKTLAEADVRALFNHDPNYVLGRNRAGTLELGEDSRGLWFAVTPPEAQWANDLRGSIRRGDINQASFQFDAVRDNWEMNAQPVERELIEVRLYDVSVVTFPAYPQTSVNARSLAQMFLHQLRDQPDPDVIKLLRDQLSQLDAPSAPGQEPHPEVGQAEEEARARRLTLRQMRLTIERMKQQ